MDKRKYREFELEDPFPYDRPSISSWVAVVAVAVAVFMLGGFIKVYIQLEKLRRDSEKDIRELRLMIDGLGRDMRVQTAVRLPAYESRGGTLPDVSDSAEPQRESTVASSGGREFAAPQRSGSLAVLQALVDIGEEDRRGITYEFGKRAPAQSQQRVEPLQIIHLGTDKRIIVEGGRNRGMEQGTRMELARDGNWIGELRVVEVMDTMSVCEVIHSAKRPQPGDFVRAP